MEWSGAAYLAIDIPVTPAEGNANGRVCFSVCREKTSKGLQIIARNQFRTKGEIEICHDENDGGKHRDLKRDFALACNKMCGKLSTNGRQTVDVAQLGWDGDASGTSKLGRHQRHYLTVYRLATKRHVAGLLFAAWVFLVCNRRNGTSDFASLVERRRTMT